MSRGLHSEELPRHKLIVLVSSLIALIASCISLAIILFSNRQRSEIDTSSTDSLPTTKTNEVGFSSIDNPSALDTSTLMNAVFWNGSRDDSSNMYHQLEIQVTWWSVIIGVAVGTILIDSIDDVRSSMGEGHWYVLLYGLTSALIAVLFWLQYAWSSLVLRWPLRNWNVT